MAQSHDLPVTNEDLKRQLDRIEARQARIMRLLRRVLTLERREEARDTQAVSLGITLGNPESL